MRLDVLSLAFIHRRYTDKIYDLSRFGMRDCLATSSQGWKLRLSLGQYELVYTDDHQYTRHFLKETCYGGSVGANIEEYNSSLCTEIQQFFETIENPNHKIFPA